jgi:hypothetical protein
MKIFFIKKIIFFLTGIKITFTFDRTFIQKYKANKTRFF